MIYHSPHNQLRILVADDEESTLIFYRTILASKRAGSQVVSAVEELAGTFSEESTPHIHNFSFDLVMCRQGNEAIEAVRASLEENRPFAMAFLDVAYGRNGRVEVPRRGVRKSRQTVPEPAREALDLDPQQRENGATQLAWTTHASAPLTARSARALRITSPPSSWRQRRRPLSPGRAA